MADDALATVGAAKKCNAGVLMFAQPAADVTCCAVHPGLEKAQ
jgi:hypothetical protein